MALHRLFQPKSTFLISRIRIITRRTKCVFCSSAEILNTDYVEEEKSISVADPPVKENIIDELVPLYVSKKPIHLCNLFKHRYDKTETITENEGQKHDESLSDVLLNLPKDGNLHIDRLSSSNVVLPSAACDEYDDHLVDLQNESEDHPQIREKLIEEVGAISSSIGIQKILELQELAMKQGHGQDVEENANGDCLVNLQKGSEDDPQIREKLINKGNVLSSSTNKRVSEKSEKLSNEGGPISPSIRTQKILELKESALKQCHEQEVEEISKPRSLFTHQYYEDSNKPCSKVDEDEGGSINIGSISDILDFMRFKEDAPYVTTKDCVDSGPAQENSVKFDVQTSEKNERFSMNSIVGDEETSIVNSVTIKHPDPEDKETTNHSIPRKSKHQNQLNSKLRSGKVSENNKVTLRFLRNNINEHGILDAFGSCGEILKIEIPNSKSPLFKVAHIYFKTTEGFTNALQRNGIYLSNGVVIVEPATSVEKITPKIPIPNLIGDPNIPALLVKNPTRTIKIANLTHEISSHHIEEALAFCKTNISGYFLGSSNGIAYVEFETEIGKERALARNCINVLGKNLEMLRIDAPRTTMLRISSTTASSYSIIYKTCESLGNVRSSQIRYPGIMDVNFALAEWPNMLNILNRLNGMELQGKRLKAEPAPIFPPDVLIALWDQPEERKLLKKTMQDLMHKLDQRTSPELPHLVNEFAVEI